MTIKINNHVNLGTIVKDYMVEIMQFCRQHFHLAGIENETRHMAFLCRQRQPPRGGEIRCWPFPHHGGELRHPHTFFQYQRQITLLRHVDKDEAIRRKRGAEQARRIDPAIFAGVKSRLAPDNWTIAPPLGGQPLQQGKDKT